MRISELISQLQEIQAEHGDLLVSVANEKDSSDQVETGVESIAGDPDPSGLKEYCVVWGS